MSASQSIVQSYDSQHTGFSMKIALNEYRKMKLGPITGVYEAQTLSLAFNQYFKRYISEMNFDF